MLDDDFSGLREITRLAIWKVSSVKSGYPISHLFDNDISTFWQTDSTPPHTVWGQFPKQTFIARVSIYVSLRDDETYTPLEFQIHVGSGPNQMEELKVVQMSIYYGWVHIDVNASTVFLGISVTKNHDGGKDTHIRQIKVFGTNSPMNGTGMGSLR